jgi:putative ABC transport system ATP-binding protein
MIRCEDIRFAYPGDPFELRFERLEAGAGERVALVGPSGCGKTTLLNLVSGILRPASGRVEVAGTPVSELAPAASQRFRLANIGLVPQGCELLDYLTVRENILVPFRVGAGGGPDAVALARCEGLAERCGIADQLGKRPNRLSQGQRQRAALCRGLVTSPRLLLADEPTGNLDPENQDRVVSLLLEEAARIGATVLMITHDPGLLPRFDRIVDVLALREGKAQGIGKGGAA